MPSVLSIEAINLNGSILTANQSRLYVDGFEVKNTSGIQLTDRFYIKGYAPISFYSRWPVYGNYLNETYINDFFMATGFLVSCTHPATGEKTLKASFYKRSPRSVINVDTFGFFELESRSIYKDGSISQRINPDTIIGLNIYDAPNEMRSISVNLLGYYQAAGAFDRMPISVNYYANDIVPKSNIYEEYLQYDASFTGWGIYCGNSGEGPIIKKDYITGYISGYLESGKIYKFNPSGNNASGYILSGSEKYFSDKNFLGFSGENGFEESLGYEFSGFDTGLTSGFFGNDTFGSDKFYQSIGYRNAYLPETIYGFMSGYKFANGAIVTLQFISGVNISGFPTGSDGFLIGSSGYFLSGNQYFFPTGTGQFSGFSGMPGFSGTTFNYFGIYNNTNLNIFSGIYPDSSGGSTGYIYGPVGTRDSILQQIISGFLIVESLPDFKLLNLSGYPQFTSGASGYYLYPFEDRKFLTGGRNQAGDKIFDGFDDEIGFYTDYGYEYSGFFSYQSGFSGAGTPFTGQDDVVGFLGTYLSNSNVAETLTGYSGNSGYIINNQRYYFPPYKSLSGQRIIGFRSGVLTSNLTFSGFTGSLQSGYFINDTRVSYGTGISDPKWNAFNNEFGFDPQLGYNFSGYFVFKSGFSGNAIGVENVTGYMSGFKTSGTNFIPLRTLSILSGSSGYFLNNVQYVFSNTQFNQFNNLEFFDAGFSYTGFTFPLGSGFSGIGTNPTGNNIYGIITGVIGSRNFYTGVGVLTGFIGSRNNLVQSGTFNGFTGMFGFSTQSGFNYSGFNNSTFFYTNLNFVQDNNFSTGYGYITGLIGTRRLTKFNKNFGSGIFTGLIGYRNFPENRPLSGMFYKKNKTGLKEYGLSFGINSGHLFAENFNSNNVFEVDAGSRVGLDIYHSMSGISDVAISLVGFYK